LAAVFTTAMAVAASTGLMSTAQASPRTTPDPAVITDWNAIAVRTIFTEGQQPPPVAQLYLGFVSTAVYDAVAAIDGRYAPYAKQPRPRPHASSQAAAATAAYQVLSHYFPASAQALGSDYAASLAKVREGAGKTHGIRAGKAAAAARVRADGLSLAGVRPATAAQVPDPDTPGRP
jgi:hypothetical protein